MSTDWTTEDALKLARELWMPLQKAGWHLALTGSLLYKGTSQKDADFVFYPRTKGKATLGDLHRTLRASGFVQTRGAEMRLEYWKQQGGEDTKYVESWSRDGKRIDVIITEAP